MRLPSPGLGLSLAWGWVRVGVSSKEGVGGSVSRNLDWSGPYHFDGVAALPGLKIPQRSLLFLFQLHVSLIIDNESNNVQLFYWLTKSRNNHLHNHMINHDCVELHRQDWVIYLRLSDVNWMIIGFSNSQAAVSSVGNHVVCILHLTQFFDWSLTNKWKKDNIIVSDSY